MIDNGAAATDPVQLPTPSEFEAPWRTILIDVGSKLPIGGANMDHKSGCSVPLVVRVVIGLVFARAVLADEPPGRPITRNVRVIAYSEVQGRPPFKMAIQERQGRWYLYMGHLWDRGWTIMDVTQPSRPRV